MSESHDPALPPHVEELAQRVLREVSERDLRLATAESCTGGLLASLLTDVPGMGRVFERGFLTYTPEAKTEMLGVEPRMVATEGEVSEAVARAMAEGALERSNADLAIAITGYTEGGPGRPAGLVHIACVRWSRPTAHRRLELGSFSRSSIRVSALEAALSLLSEQLSRRAGEAQRRVASAEGSRSWSGARPARARAPKATPAADRAARR
jgi:nicotinamide-nucleotide amidase